MSEGVTRALAACDIADAVDGAMSLARRAAFAVFLPACLAACGADVGPTRSASRFSDDARAYLDPRQRHVLYVDLFTSYDGGSRNPTDRQHPVVALPAGQCGRPLITPTRERRTDRAEVRHLRLYLVRVACPHEASRMVGG